MFASAEPEDIRNLRALKGPPLSILFAMFLTPATVAKGGYLVSATGFSMDRVSIGASALEAMGLLQKVGRYDWMLTARAKQLPLTKALADALGRLFSQSTPQNAESTSLPALPSTPQKTVSYSQRGTLEEENQPEKAAIPATPQNAESNGPLTALTSIELNLNALAFRQFDQALRAAGVWPNLRGKMADELLADDTADWLRQILGWIAYLTNEGANTPTKRGAATRQALTLRRQVPEDRYLPPEGMPFDQALAWAERGGQAEPEPAPPPTAESAEPAGEPLPFSASADLWARAQLQLRQILPRPTTDLLQLCTLQDGIEPGSYVLLCPAKGTTDWIRTRINGKLVEALSHAAGQIVTVSVQTIIEA